jgi:hypothetical protein
MRIDVAPGTCGCGCGEKVTKQYARGHVLKLVRKLVDAHKAKDPVLVNGQKFSANTAANPLLSGASLERFGRETFIPDHPVGTEVRAQIQGWNHRAVVAALDSAGDVSEVRYIDKRGLSRVTDRFTVLS